MHDLDYEVIKNIKVLAQGKRTTKELNLVKWGTMEPTYDIRKWHMGQPRKGITLTKEEAWTLYDALGTELEV